MVQGNIEGNPVYANAVPAMETLLSDIRNCVNTTYPGKSFYLMGNNPQEIAVANPASLKNLDAIFNETAYYQQSPTKGFVSVSLLRLGRFLHTTAAGVDKLVTHTCVYPKERRCWKS